MRGSLRIVALLAIPVLLAAWILSAFATLYALPATAGAGMGASNSIPDAHLQRLLDSGTERTRQGPGDTFDNVFWFIHVSFPRCVVGSGADGL